MLVAVIRRCFLLYFKYSKPVGCQSKHLGCCAVAWWTLFLEVFKGYGEVCFVKLLVDFMMEIDISFNGRKRKS